MGGVGGGLDWEGQMRESWFYAGLEKDKKIKGCIPILFLASFHDV